ncbi:hypothetical protein PsorP6_001194 [Peronosclerospora sorghi]|uniref:Uncharacterized protein n=1 Tax=Peronosclerospora sorghi TaxID=230839 RepID=A0ACC0WVZ9_9STRA|nr:hypothetical protein PsorP6_001194 [Peronosclerospora sorghi]
MTQGPAPSSSRPEPNPSMESADPETVTEAPPSPPPVVNPEASTPRPNPQSVTPPSSSSNSNADGALGPPSLAANSSLTNSTRKSNVTRGSGTSDKNEALVPPVATPEPHTVAPTPAPPPSSPPPVPRDPTTANVKPTESAESGSSLSPSGSSDSLSPAQVPNSKKTPSPSSHETPFSPPPVTVAPQMESATKAATSADLNASSALNNASSSSELETVTLASSASSASDISEPKGSPPPVTIPPTTTAAPPPKAPTNSSLATSPSNSETNASFKLLDSSKSDADLADSASSGLPTSADDIKPSPAPVTRPPTMTTDHAEALDGSEDVSQTTEQISPMAPSPPSSKTVSMPPSKALPESMGTVKAANISEIDNSVAEAVRKQVDGSDVIATNTLKNDDMIMLSETHSKITYIDGSKVTTFKKYNRGNVDLEMLDNGSESYNRIIVGGGNRSNLPPGASISLSSMSRKIQNALLYASYAFAIVSTMLLMLFHLLALQHPPWLGGSSDSFGQGESNCRGTMDWLTPNAWDLVVVVGYIQHINSISMLELTKAPQIVLDFSDSFSFVNLHLSSATTTTVAEASRRLQLVILTGIVAFSDRIGIDEDRILISSVWFFLAVVATLVVLFALAAAFACYYHQVSADSRAAFLTTLRSSFAMCVLGLGVALWVLCVFPLVTMSSYELTMELRYRVGLGLAVALFCLWVVVGGGLSYAFMSVRAIPMKDAFHFKHFALWGSLYADSKMAFRYFFVVTVCVQILLGLLTGAVSAVPMQLVSLMVTHLLFVVATVIIRPFAARWVLGMVVSLRVVAITNMLCSFAFLTSSEMSVHWRGIVAQAFVILNAIVVFVLFARCIAMFVLALKRWSGFTRRESIIYSHHNPKSAQGLDHSRNQTPIFLTYDSRAHRRLRDGGRFIASGTGFAPDFSSSRASHCSDHSMSTPAYTSRPSSGQQSTPAYYSDPRVRGRTSHSYQ